MIENEPLAKHTSWRIGGPARYYLEALNVDELRNGLQWANERDLPIFVLGGGTNLLVGEEGFPGLVLRYRSQVWHIEAQGVTGVLHVAAGAPVAGTVRRLCAQGWGGLEWAEGLPGTIGGAIYGNAGCYGSDIARVLERAYVLVDDEVQEWSTAQLGYGYRTSCLKQAQSSPGTVHDNAYSRRVAPIVLTAELRLTQDDPTTLAATMARIAAERKAKTPWGRSCGSVFKNPVVPDGTRLSAGQLIDQAGLKGARSGAAEISQRHANYIINLGGATSADVLRLIELVRTTVLRQFNVTLELEVQVI